MALCTTCDFNEASRSLFCYDKSTWRSCQLCWEIGYSHLLVLDRVPKEVSGVDEFVKIIKYYMNFCEICCHVRDDKMTCIEEVMMFACRHKQFLDTPRFKKFKKTLINKAHEFIADAREEDMEFVTNMETVLAELGELN